MLRRICLSSRNSGTSRSQISHAPFRASATRKRSLCINVWSETHVSLRVVHGVVPTPSRLQNLRHRRETCRALRPPFLLLRVERCCRSRLFRRPLLAAAALAAATHHDLSEPRLACGNAGLILLT